MSKFDTSAERSAMDFIEWLNHNAGAVQTLSSVVLVGITWRYVALTGRLANAAESERQESVHRQKQAFAQNWATVSSAAASMHDVISTLPIIATPMSPELFLLNSAAFMNWRLTDDQEIRRMEDIGRPLSAHLARRIAAAAKAHTLFSQNATIAAIPGQTFVSTAVTDLEQSRDDLVHKLAEIVAYCDGKIERGAD